MINPQMRLVTRNVAFELLHLLIFRPELGSQLYLLTDKASPGVPVRRGSKEPHTRTDDVEEEPTVLDELSEATRGIVRDYYNLMGAHHGAATASAEPGVQRQGCLSWGEGERRERAERQRRRAQRSEIETGNETTVSALLLSPV